MCTVKAKKGNKNIKQRTLLSFTARFFINYDKRKSTLFALVFNDNTLEYYQNTKFNNCKIH